MSMILKTVIFKFSDRLKFKNLINKYKAYCCYSVTYVYDNTATEPVVTLVADHNIKV
jgi:hypothetical protein